MAYNNRESEIVIAGKKVRLSHEITQTRFLLLSCLNMHFNEFVGVQYLADKCQPDKNRYLQDWIARPHIVDLRKALQSTGFEIINSRARGYKLTNCKAE